MRPFACACASWRDALRGATCIIGPVVIAVTEWLRLRGGVPDPSLSRDEPAASVTV